MSKYLITTLLHQPFWCTRSATDAYCLYPIKPVHVDFIGALNLMGVWIHT